MSKYWQLLSEEAWIWKLSEFPDTSNGWLYEPKLREEFEMLRVSRKSDVLYRATFSVETPKASGRKALE